MLRDRLASEHEYEQVLREAQAAPMNAHSSRPDLATVPVALFTFRRPQHTRRVLEGLRHTGAPLLYAFSDGPRSAADTPLVDEVRALLREVDWADVRLVERGPNLGLAESIKRGVSEVLSAHPSLLVLEDDCVPAPDFYRVMSELLHRFADVPRAFSVSGYGPPVEPPGGFPYTHYWARRPSSWGWGTWRDRWQGGLPSADSLLAEARRQRIDLASIGADLPALLGRASHADAWTPAWILRAALEDGLTLWPVRSLVTNIGNDGTGAHGGRTDRFDVGARLWASGAAACPPPAVCPTTEVERSFSYFMANLGRRERLRRTPDRLRTSAMDTARRVLFEVVAPLRQPPLRPLRRLLKEPRHQPGRAPLDGHDMEYVDARSFYFQVHEIFVDGVYRLDPGMDVRRILDCGANVGTAARWFRREHPDAELISIEADPHIAAVLRRNLRTAGDDRTTVLEGAAWTHGGEVCFASSAADEGRVSEEGGRRVKAFDLAALCASPVDLLKLDIEGGEHAVVPHLARTGALARVQRVVCEVHERGGEAEDLPELLAALRAAGFRYAFRDARPAPSLSSGPSGSGFAAVPFDGRLMLVYAWRDERSSP